MLRFGPVVVCVALLAAPAAIARPSGPALFCDAYPDSATCAGRGVACVGCHTSTSPEAPAWNNYGLAILSRLSADFDSELAAVLPAIEDDDSDGDGLSNLEEIELGTLPGDPLSYWVPARAPSGPANPAYTVGAWDPAFAGKRVLLAFCGFSPTAEQLEALAAAADPRATVHGALDACVQSDFWCGEGLARLADEKIRPIDFGASFEWDYRLWRYVMTGDRDVRDLLLATYHVREASPGVLSAINNVDNDGTSCTSDADCAFDSACDGVCVFRAGAQPLVAGERAGMIGTQWFHFINTMFSFMPRTTAAHAMRAYLGLDLARLEGIAPTANEPLDVDDKGVAQAECAQCHSTLDPATYVFAKYQGIENGGASLFNPNRPIALGLWAPGSEPQGRLFGQDVTTLREWAQVAAASDQFQHHLARVLFEHAVGRAPGPQDAVEWDALWRSWPAADVGFTATGFLHRLIDTDAFGAP